MKTCSKLLFVCVWELMNVVLIKTWKWGANKTYTSLLTASSRLDNNIDK